MLKRLAGRFSPVVMLAVLAAMLNVVDVATKALAEPLQRLRAKSASTLEQLRRAQDSHACGLTWFDAYRSSFLPAIAGGAPTPTEEMKNAVKASVGEVLDEKLKPVVDRLQALEGRVDKADKEVVRYDAT